MPSEMLSGGEAHRRISFLYGSLSLLKDNFYYRGMFQRGVAPVRWGNGTPSGLETGINNNEILSYSFIYVFDNNFLFF